MLQISMRRVELQLLQVWCVSLWVPSRSLWNWWTGGKPSNKCGVYVCVTSGPFHYMTVYIVCLVAVLGSFRLFNWRYQLPVSFVYKMEANKRSNVSCWRLAFAFQFASATPCYYRMETSAARKLTLVFLLLAVWGCQSMQHSVESVRRSLRSLRSPRAQEGANMESMLYSREADSDSSDAAVNTGVQNLTVPHFLLHELYLHLEKPIDHTYSDVNSILSFENQANASESLLHFMYC